MCRGLSPRALVGLAAAGWIGAVAWVVAPVEVIASGAGVPQETAPPATAVANPHVQGDVFETSDHCMACHNSLTAPSGEDISIGFDWRVTMMANSARDPYWHAAVRREVLDHPEAQAAIEDKCSTCHMPMARYQSAARGESGTVFGHLPIGEVDDDLDSLAADGVSCSVCHQITDEGFGEESSFDGGFVLGSTPETGGRHVFGPFEIEDGQVHIMESASGFMPGEGTHVQSSDLCATCHTLFTAALGPAGQQIGELPEQMPYLEWLHSDYRDGGPAARSCQSCHMPEIAGETPIAAVLGEPRENFSRHAFLGGNFFMQRMLNRYRDELGVTAPPRELAAAADRTIAHLRAESVNLSVGSPQLVGGRLQFAVAVENLTGHKLPTAYPARRSWLHVTVRDGAGAVAFESGAFAEDGQVVGDDNDEDAGRFEPHYQAISSPDQVQIYEVIMVDEADAVTTGLLTGVRYTKDSRLLPHGFDKATADEDVAVHGGALDDADFVGGGDRTSYRVDVSGRQGPFQVEVELWYQPIGYRWFANIAAYDAPAIDRFARYYESMAADSAIVIAREVATTSR